MPDPKPKSKTCPRCYASCAATIKAIDEMFGYRFKHTKDIRFSQSHCRECRRSQLSVVPEPEKKAVPEKKAKPAMSRAEVQREYRRLFPKDKVGASKPTAELLKRINSKQKAS